MQIFVYLQVPKTYKRLVSITNEDVREQAGDSEFCQKQRDPLFTKELTLDKGLELATSKC